MASRVILYGPCRFRMSLTTLMKGIRGRRGLISLWYFLISCRAVRLVRFFFFGSLVGLSKLDLGHLAAMVGGLGQLLVGAGAAVTRLDSSKGTLGVSATVSATTVEVEVEGCTTGLGSSSCSVLASTTFSAVTGVGGLFLRSSTRSLSSSMLWGGSSS